MLTAFVGPCPEGQQCAHFNGIRDDNRLPNLRWATRSENYEDQRRHGTNAQGARHGNTKMTAAQVLELIERVNAGESKASVGRRFKIDPRAVLGIYRGEWWAHARVN
jgi:hypothetical protein